MLPTGYLELRCCLTEFTNPSIMDIKMGQITFSKTEVGNYLSASLKLTLF